MIACANLSFLFKESGPLLARYGAAAAAGFNYVENDFPLDASPQEVEKAVKDSGVQQVLMNCFHGNVGEVGFASIPGQEEEFKASLFKTLEYTRVTNCKKVHIMSGRELGPEKFNEQLKTFENNLRWAAEKLKEENIIGLIEPINPYALPAYFMKSFDTALSIIEAISSPNIRLMIDLFHLQMITGNITNNLKRLLPVTGHIQIAQSPHRHEPSTQGEVNLKYVLEQIRNAGYEGPIGLEYNPSEGSTVQSLGWIEEYGLKF